MRTQFTPRAARDYKHLSPELQALIDKQMSFLRQSLRHPSIRAKKYDEGADIWQGRINRDFRFYFHISGDVYYIITIIPHPK